MGSRFRLAAQMLFSSVALIVVGLVSGSRGAIATGAIGLVVAWLLRPRNAASANYPQRPDLPVNER